MATGLGFGLSACEKDKHKHAYTEEIIAPTCTAQGYTTHACKCGDSYKDNYVDALGHEFKNYVSDGNETCEADGTKTAKCEHTACEETDTLPDVWSKLPSELSFKTLSVEGTSACTTVSNATESFSFKDEIQTTGFMKYIVSLDPYGTQSAPLKIVSLASGDNTFYVIEMLDGEAKTVFEVTIRRRPMYTVSFRTNGGTAVESQSIEEDSFASVPTKGSTRVGYTFDKWDFDFATPITKNTTIDAQWKINQYTVTVVYGNGQPNKTITQDYDTSIELQNPTARAGYTFGGWDKALIVPAYDTTITAKWLAVFNVEGNVITGLTDHGKRLTKIVVPFEIDGVKITSIGSSAFSGCSGLTSVTIPDSVTEIGSSAFYGCDSLEAVYYQGTESDWNEISIDYDNSELRSATRYYYSETKPTATGNYWHYDESGAVAKW